VEDGDGDWGGVTRGGRAGGVVEGPRDCGASAYDICTSMKPLTLDKRQARGAGGGP
jgi:hypothetical protein